MNKFTGLLAATAIALSSGMAFAEEIVIKFAHTTGGTTHPKVKASEAFAARVNEQMAGKVKVELYPNSQLGGVSQILEGMLLGDIQMGAPSLSKFEQYTLKLRIFDLPFVFEDIDAVDRFQNGPTGQELLNSVNDAGLQGLAFWHNGMKQMSANSPLIAPSDAAGKKFRVQSSDVLKAQFEELGATPQKMAFSEVFGALQQGVVDGQENTWSNIYTKKFFEVQDSITETNHGVIDYLVVTSAEFWGSLPDDIRSELETILAEVSAEANANSAAINQTNRDKILEDGGKINELTAEQRNAWVEAMKPVWSKFTDDIGQDVLDAALDANGAS
ncbi:DctP family TRAP transporter solute-binding subunit [uncultured Roseovarius sp.]|uniref:DctP family TRAP transporter solute-binding subunit n=1 Tax=uncultured Roseovarius sp. TaxID=293344 RepID=UPI00263258E4|nr:DctP family TRAP transporter solute-binding subunit [uncultured Roseovarius sp.]